jgi:hypothetical protein
MRYALCIKDVVMEHDEILAFEKGNEYTICHYDIRIEAINNQGEEHIIAENFSDPWFHEHFKIVEEIREVGI